MSEIVDGNNENLSVTSTAIKLSEKMSSEQAAPFIQRTTEALCEKNIYLTPEDYIINGLYNSETSLVTIDYLPADWKELGPMKSVSGTAYFVSFKNVDISAGTGTLAGVQMIDGIDISIDYGNTYTIKLKELQ